MPTFLDEPLEAVRAVCSHPGAFSLNCYLHNDLHLTQPDVNGRKCYRPRADTDWYDKTDDVHRHSVTDM